MASATEGTLFLCATPIGNLEDITLRVLRVLQEVDLIAAEDTRHTRKLLTHYHIRTSLTSYHRYNETDKADYILRLLSQGRHVALVSDAGMPGISDPGHDLIVRVIAGGYPVVPLPGPSAVLTALVVSGMPTTSFVFAGFLPRNKQDRRRLLEEMASEQRTMVFFEAPHRLVKTLEVMREVWGPRSMAVVREATKVHEEVLRGEPTCLCAHFRAVPPRGEITLVVHGVADEVAHPEEAGPLPGPEDVFREVRRLTRAGMDGKEALKRVARQYGMTKRDVYAVMVEKKGEETDEVSSP